MGTLAGRTVPASLTDGHFVRAKAGGTDLEGVAGGGSGLSADEVIDLVHPVGSLYVSTISTNPGTLFGRGTWTAFGAGRVMVGIDAGQTEFDVVEETGGAKTHTLLTTEIPAHNHLERGTTTSTGNFEGLVRDTSAGGTGGSPSNVGNCSAGFETANTGGGGAHNNVQPYIVVYMWKRTA
jgi:hypothetical protein